MTRRRIATPQYAEVKAVLAEELVNRTFTYTRSDGSTWDLTLADLIERTPAMEVAYNPNVSAEKLSRTGATETSPLGPPVRLVRVCLVGVAAV